MAMCLVSNGFFFLGEPSCAGQTHQRSSDEALHDIETNFAAGDGGGSLCIQNGDGVPDRERQPLAIAEEGSAWKAAT